MKKTIVITLGVLVIVALVLAITPTTRDEIHWRWASYKDQTISYESYVKAWPKGNHSVEAKTLYDQRGWADAQTSNTVKGFERYVKFHSEGKHVTEAKDNIERLHWQVATASNTIRSYRAYLAAHPHGRFTSEAETKASTLRAVQAPYDAALRTGTEASLRKFLIDYPGHKKESNVQQAIKDITEGRNIVDLLKEKKIEIKTQGCGIKSVRVHLRKLVPYPITVRIPVGSYFVSARRSAQNMIITSESSIRLTTDDWKSVLVSAACANRPKKIPRGRDRFTVQRSSHQAELARLMPLLDKAKAPYAVRQAPYAVRQAAVWIVTDNADYGDLGILVSYSQFRKFAGTRQIKQYEAARAMKICDEVGIDVKKKAIWRDRQKILTGLKDKDLKKWLESK